jgi:hypothetical protein
MGETPPVTLRGIPLREGGLPLPPMAASPLKEGGQVEGAARTPPVTLRVTSPPLRGGQDSPPAAYGGIPPLRGGQVEGAEGKGRVLATCDLRLTTIHY